MLEVKQGVSFEVPVRLVVLSTGQGVTGVTAPTVYLAKHGDAQPTAKAITNGVNWRELSAANMPGNYWLTLSAADVSTPGPLLVTASGGDSDRMNVAYQVLPYTRAEMYRYIDWLRQFMTNDSDTDEVAKTYSVKNDAGGTLFTANLRNASGVGSVTDIKQFRRVGTWSAP